LLANGVPVFQTLPQIRAELRNAFSDEHALLFAEPNANPVTGDVQWYAPIGGVISRLSDLTGAELQAAREKISRLASDIDRHAEELKLTGHDANRLMGNNLSLALEIPHEDHIYVVSAQPVLAGWGHVPRGPAAPQRRLLKMADQILAASASQVSKPTDTPSTAEVTDTPRSYPADPLSTEAKTWNRHRLEISRNTLSSVPYTTPVFAWWSALLWLLFALLLLLIGHLLLKNCAIAWPGGVNILPRSIVNYCAASARAAVDPQDAARQGPLLDRLAELEGTLRDRRNACAAQPQPDSKGIVTERGGKIGAVNVILSWDTTDDLDLYVTCPDQTEISFSQPRACGGTLDVDANVGTIVPTPVENITWPAEAVRPGEYRVDVQRYTKRSGGQSTPFRIELLIDSKRVELHCDAVENSKKRIFTFKLPYESGNSSPAQCRSP
jgi:hypothetical protein